MSQRQRDREFAYLNNCGAGLIAESTLNVVKNYLQREAELGAMVAAQEAKGRMSDFYRNVASLLSASSSDQIAFADSASRAWNMALYGSAVASGDVILTLSSEFGTNLVSIYHFAARVGATVKVIQCDNAGNFSMSEIESALRAGVQLIAISHVAAHCSIVNPVEEIGELCQKFETTYLVDGCQSVGQMPVDVNAIRCHAYTGTGRKWLRGPRGTGFLYVQDASRFATPQVDLASADLVFDTNGTFVGSVEVRKDARQFELWERSVAGMLGLSTAVEAWTNADQTTCSSQIAGRADVLRAAVDESGELDLLGAAESRSGIVGFTTRLRKGEDALAEAFDAARITYSTMQDWDCPLHFPKDAGRIFRLSPHCDTPDSSVEAAIRVIRTFEG